MDGFITGFFTLIGTVSGGYLTHLLDSKRRVEINFQQSQMECFTLINKIPFLLVPLYVRCINVLTEGKDLVLPQQENPIETFNRIEFIILRDFKFLFENFFIVKDQFIEQSALLSSNVLNPQITKENLESKFNTFITEISKIINSLNKELMDVRNFENKSKLNFWILKNKMKENIKQFFSRPN